MKKSERTSRRERELAILREMELPTKDEETPSAPQDEAPDSASPEDSVRCPACGRRFVGHICPHCGYHGYIPMSDRQILRMKWILAPIVLLLALLVYLWSSGYFQ